MIIKNTARMIQELGQRSNQEDSLFPPYTPKTLSQECYILCDGMGGHSAGEVASGAVCEAMGRYVGEHPRDDGCYGEEDFQAALDAAFDALDELDDGAEKKMGTTLTFLKIHRSGCFVAHIGDSRVYQIRPSEKELLFVTRDHSLVNDLIALGELTPEEARTSPQRNVITRAIQPHLERRPRADMVNLTDIRAGDYFFLCSDGMLENTEDGELVNILSMNCPDAEKIKMLLGVTRENRDNHSAILVHIGEVSGEESDALPQPPVIERKSRHIWLLVCVFLALLLLASLYIVYKIKTN